MIDTQSQNNRNIPCESSNVNISEINNTLNGSYLNNSSNNKTIGNKQNSKVIINNQNSKIDKRVWISKEQSIMITKSLYYDNIKIKSIDLVKNSGYYHWLIEIKGSFS